MDDVKEIFVSAGDFSGDMQIAFLVKNLKKKSEGIKISGIGGNFLKNENINFLVDIVKEQGFGFGINILKKYFFFKDILYNIIEPYLKKNLSSIKVVILVDFYGFNIHLARLAKKLGLKVVYYICPQIWASRKNRIKNIKKFVDVVIPIFPFEKEIYESENIKVNYFGNPLIDIVNEKKSIENNNENYENQKNFYEKNFLIGIMPGSRISEIKNILPIIIKLLNILIEKSKTNLELKSKLDNIKFVLILAENIDEDFLKLNFSKFSENEKYSKFFNIVEIVKGPAYILRQKMKFILTSSGTSSFENTILGIPMMIFYKLDLFSYNFAKLIIKIPFIGMPNILAKKMIMPEYIQKFNFDKILNEIIRWILDENCLKNKKNELENVIRCFNIQDDSKNTDKHQRIIDKISDFILKFDILKNKK